MRSNIDISDFYEILISAIESNTVLYNGTILGISVNEETDTVQIYHSYYFRKHLKEAGFIWDNERKAWVGELKNFLNMDKEVLIRMLKTSSKKSLYNLGKLLMKLNSHSV